MNEELNSLEISSRALADFPDAPGLCVCTLPGNADEARHALMFRKVMEQRGGLVAPTRSQLSIPNRVPLCDTGSSPGRSEQDLRAGGIDALATAVTETAQAGDVDLLRLFEYQEADEIAHVRYAMSTAQCNGRGPRVALDVARALTEPPGHLLKCSEARPIAFATNQRRDTSGGGLSSG